MDIIVERFRNIKSKINNNKVNIIAVSKTFPFEHIKSLVEEGHEHFGENKVQEATHKWLHSRQSYPDIKLHMIGKLQSNKAKGAVELFDFVHSLDSQKLADNLHKCETNQKKKLKYFIQVNVGQETQKSGLHPSLVDQFYNYCTKEIKLNIIGLMSIPPLDGNTEKHFQYLYETNASLGLKELSMGMSADYNLALKYSSTFVRIGSAIFGERV